MRIRSAICFVPLAAAYLTAGPLAADDLSKARRAAQPATSLPASANPYAAPNPYAPAQPAPAAASERAADAYATGFAIGLGTALINKQNAEAGKQR